MAHDNFTDKCRGCGEEMQVRVLACPHCDLRIEGSISLPRLARLSAADREFIELFVLSGGSLKEVGKILNISYPTVRGRLDSVIQALKKLDRSVERQRMDILAKLQNREITSEEALKQLNDL